MQVRKLDGIDVVTKFGYDAFGSLVQTIDPNTNVISVVYDKLGRKTDLKDPDLGWIHYDVDPLGQVWRQVSPKQRAAAQSTTFRFDSLGRMTARYEPDLESHWVFDQKPGTACLAGRSCGQLVEAYTQTGSVKDYIRSHTFDVLGRTRTTVQVIGDGNANSTFQTTTDYDDWSRAIRQTYQRNADVAKVFDSRYNNAGYLARLERGAIVLWQVDEQDASKRPTRVAYGNGLTQSDVFNVNTDRLENATLATGAGLLRLQEGYYYDALGNVTTRTQFWDKGGFTETFKYDELNRLKFSEVGTRQQKFAYDDAGNIKSWIGGDNTGGANYVYPVQGNGAVRPHAVQQIDAGPVYQYDANGNMTVAPGRTYTWNSFDMPISMSKAGSAGMVSSTFVYGPEHQRTRQTRSDGSVEVYGGAQVTEKSKAGVLTVKTYWPYGVGLEIDVAGAPAVLQWIHTDRLGSPVAISDQAGVLKERLAYDAWGKRRSTDGTNLTPDSLDGTVDNRGFTGHEMLDQLDLIHMNGRVFDPSIGRFLTPDLLLQDPINGQNYNRYSYVLNNPTNLTDPTGFACQGTKPDPGCEAPAPSESDKKDREEKAKKLKDCKALTTCLTDGNLVWVKDGDGNAAAYKVDDAKASNGKFIARDGSSFTVASANSGTSWYDNPGLTGSPNSQRAAERRASYWSAFFGGDYSVMDPDGMAGHKHGENLGLVVDAGAVAAPFVKSVVWISGLRGGGWAVTGGAGPVPGVIGITDTTAVGMLRNYSPKGGGVEFVYDSVARTFVAGRPAKGLFNGSPHEQLAKSIGAADRRVLGGTFHRGANGRVFTTENSGHYGQNWNNSNRKEFQDWLSDRLRVPVQHQPWDQ